MQRINKTLDPKYLSQLALPLVYNKSKYISTDVEGKVLNPWWLTGLADAESCFRIAIWRDNKSKTGWNVRAEFSIELHVKELALLKQIQNYFGCVGDIRNNKGNNSFVYTITKLKDITGILIPHFEHYPMLTQKNSDFLLFKRIIELMKNKSHLTYAGLEEIVGIRASLNKGLSDELKEAFPNHKQVDRPLVDLVQIPDPNWLVGFTDGEGCFHVRVREDFTYKVGYQVSLQFIITQHIRDIELINSLIDCFGPATGKIIVTKPYVRFFVSKFTDITEHIIPFFERYPLLSAKKADFIDFSKSALLIKTNAHRTQERLEQIQLIKSGMNTGRKHNDIE